VQENVLAFQKKGWRLADLEAVGVEVKATPSGYDFVFRRGGVSLDQLDTLLKKLIPERRPRCGTGTHGA
jgi:hypothetical protein